MSLFLTGKPIGVSAVYEEIGRLFWDALAPGTQGSRPPTRAMTFTLGILISGLALSQSMGHTAAQAVDISGSEHSSVVVR